MIKSELKADSDPGCPLWELYDVLGGVDYDVSPWLELTLQNPLSPTSKRLTISQCYSFKNQICATIPQAGLLYGFFQNSFYEADRSDKFSYHQTLEVYRVLRKNYYQPYVAASCIFDVVENSSDEAPLQFRRILEKDSDRKESQEIISIPGLTKGQIINDTSGDNSNFRVHWIDLPQDVFGTGIPGAVIVNPRGPKGPPYYIYQCTSDVGWGSSVIETDAVTNEDVVSHRTKSLPGEKPYRISDAYGYQYVSTPDFSSFSSLPYPERRISVSKNWMELLNPTFVLNDNSTSTLISRYLSFTTHQLEEAYVARMFAVLLSVALSKTGIKLDREGFYEHI